MVVINFTEEKRVRLATVLQCFNALSTLCSLFLISGGLFIKFRVEDKVALIEDYGNIDGLCYTLMAFGVLGVGLNLFGMKVSSDSKSPETRSKGLVIYMAVTALFCLLVFCAGITTFAHKMHLQSAFDKGITKAMNQYQHGGSLKIEVDILQTEYHCCGSEGPEDWFKMQWINNRYINQNSPTIRKKMSDGQYLTSDVPFSCCNMRYNRPCIHHGLTGAAAGTHYNFKYEGAQKHIIYQTGCKEALMNYFGGQVLETVGGTIMVIWVFQLAVTFGVRYLQTAIGSIDPSDPEGDSKGHIFASPAKKDKDTEGGSGGKQQKSKKSKKFGKITGKFGKNKKKPVPPEPDYDQVPNEEPLEWTLDPSDSSFENEPDATQAPAPPPPPPPP